MFPTKFSRYFTFLALLSLSGLSLKIYGQKSDTSQSTQSFITARYHYGIVLPHHTSMGYFINDFSRGFELTWGRSNFGKDNWERYFNYPEIGIGMYYGSFGNKNIYGDGMALFPYINFNIFRTRTFTSQYKVSLGVGYATKPFDREENIYNAVFGSHFNAYVGLGLLLDYRVSKRFSVASTVSYHHLSNGGIKKPNNGINTATISLGTKYHFSKEFPQPSRRPEIPKLNDKELLVIGWLGNSQGTTFTPRYYWSWGLSASHLWNKTIKRAVGIGFDMMYFGSAPYFYIQNNDDVEYHFKDKFYGGLFLAYNKSLGRTTMYFNLGAYIFNGVKPDQPIYPRLGVRYSVSRNIIAHFGIKANFFTAEYLEFGLGYRLPYSKK